MLRPFLLVGIGGSGGKTLRALRVALERRLVEIPDWDGGWPDAWQIPDDQQWSYRAHP